MFEVGALDGGPFSCNAGAAAMEDLRGDGGFQKILGRERNL